MIHTDSDLIQLIHTVIRVTWRVDSPQQCLLFIDELSKAFFFDKTTESLPPFLVNLRGLNKQTDTEELSVASTWTDFLVFDPFAGGERSGWAQGDGGVCRALLGFRNR
ncbi:hypothetical protein IRJ41_005897 [Triplophysa rosa]|uniref:Uncharacterized protein n=1 Tax=Triplophysa rosa TaxID=992332 RepID=A0A9W7THY6_TRIRA|nr:hypothetical protein IRJ41_005897 [Triplophysa rosa]